ncbi:DUF2282 domain-containing protein [Teredinibacter turnerae]|uniref:Membrane protein n=1 Tax=Teredinibacter turnerae (strain ATCC 39867 / T7901) TaxID=377629 RepID=C5BQA8_TERTT|nr:DUF2282 domain-containing protein [Teredinibacter turnerae]ACR13913.1 putative membrane protein [Teredinibacter turnerae T7901]
MKNMNKSVVISSAIAAGVMMATAGTSAHAAQPTMEKCYGIVKAGKNDCAIASQGTSCAGQAKKDSIADAWIYVPKGKCDAIVGGSLTPKKDK